MHVTAAEAVSVIRPGHRVFVHSVAGAPAELVAAMAARAGELRDVEVVHLHTEGPAPYADPGMEASFRVKALFVGANVRKAVEEGRADYVPVFLSEIPRLFRSRRLPIDVAMLTVSPPDRHGFCSLGTSVDVSLAAAESARWVIAEVNPNVPRSHGDGHLPLAAFHATVESDRPLPEHHGDPIGETERAIARHVAGLVEDGATLQTGIGAIPDAVLAALVHHKDLGVHTEMFSDGLLGLVESGALTGTLKTRHPGKIVAGFCVGTRRLYDFVDDNPDVAMLDIGYVNDTSTIRRNPRVTAINSAIEVDLTGQVCADSIGARMYSGVGGQMDFIRGASLSEGGKPIIALPSRTRKGQPRIVPTLQPGAGVVTTRAHVHYVVTEHGAADLYGKSLSERARALVDVAHPADREALDRAAFARFGRR